MHLYVYVYELQYITWFLLSMSYVLVCCMCGVFVCFACVMCRALDCLVPSVRRSLVLLVAAVALIRRFLRWRRQLRRWDRQ